MTTNIGRRALIGTSAAAAVGGLFTGFGAGKLLDAPAPEPEDADYLPFYGKYQSGILDPQQLHAVFVGWDLAWREGNKKDQLRAILQMISDDAARLMSGRGVLADTEPEIAAPASQLSLTVGVGQTLLDVAGRGKIGVLPEFGGDQLDDQYGQADLLIQFCGQDPTVLHHAVRAVSKNLRGLATQRFSQAGFIQPEQNLHGGAFRNLFGQVDGTNNPAGELREAAVFQDSWIENGTTLALRRFEMDLDGWDELDVAGRDHALGRRQSDGSPLSGGDFVDLNATNELGLPSIAANAHVALARPTNGDEVIHRRGYNFTGERSGLLFASYQRDPALSFIPLQHRLAAADALNRWLKPVGSGLYAILPGASHYLGEALL